MCFAYDMNVLKLKYLLYFCSTTYEILFTHIAELFFMQPANKSLPKMMCAAKSLRAKRKKPLEIGPK